MCVRVRARACEYVYVRNVDVTVYVYGYVRIGLNERKQCKCLHDDIVLSYTVRSRRVNKCD